MILDDTVGFGVFAILKSVPRMDKWIPLTSTYVGEWLDGWVVTSPKTWQDYVLPFTQV